MTTSSTEQLVVAALRKLAEAEEPTGHVARFPMLRKECVLCRGTSRRPPFGLSRDSVKCDRCHSLGWAPLTVGEVHGEKLLLLAAKNERVSIGGGQLFRRMIDALEATHHTAKTERDFVQALVLALDAAMPRKE